MTSTGNVACLRLPTVTVRASIPATAAATYPGAGTVSQSRKHRTSPVPAEAPRLRAAAARKPRSSCSTTVTAGPSAASISGVRGDPSSATMIRSSSRG